MTARSTEEPDGSIRDRSADDEPSAALAGSHIVSAVRAASTRATSWVRNSALYRWLTAEPDPDVIVIDLRETWTVGPVLRVLDWVLDRLVDASNGSQFVNCAQRGAAATRAAPMRMGGILLAAVGLVVAGIGLLGGVSTLRLAVGVGLAIVGLIAMQDDREWASLRETRPISLAIAAFEPPAPPESEIDEEAIDENTETADADSHQRP